ncbi:hypothetical protein ACHWQZ_G012046 [Mnemiopsis leidyi]
MHVLFPDLYSPKEQVTTMMAGRVVPPTSRIENNRQIYIASQSVGLYSMHFLSTTPTVAIGFGNGKFNVHDLNTTKRCHTGQASPDHMPVTCIRDYVDSDIHRIVSGTADGWVKSFSFDLEDGMKEMSSIHLANPIYSLDTSENYHICALDNRQIKVLDAVRAEYVRDVGRISTEEYSEEEEVGHQQRVTCVKFRPDNRYQCVSAGWDKSVYLWDIRMEPDKAAVRTMKGPKICGDGLDIHNDILLSASFSTENALQMWDLGSGNLIQTICYRENENEAEYLYSCRFVDSNRIVAGGSGSRDAKIINIKTGVIEGVFFDTKPIHSVGYKDGVVAAGGVSCYIHVGDFNQVI